MESKAFIQMQLEGLKRTSGRVLKDLTQADYAWRPAAGCNSIGLIFFHVSRSEDMFIQQRLLNQPLVWQADKWFQKMAVPENEAGSHYNLDQVNAFAVPDYRQLLAYNEAVRSRTVDYVAGLQPADLDRKLTITPFPGDTNVAAILSLVVMHSVQHFGEISYIRGIYRGMDK